MASGEQMRLPQSRTASRRIYWRFALPSALLACVLLLMWRSAVRDPGPTGLPGDLPNWHNRPGDLASVTRFVLVEAVVAFVIFRPWSYHRNWRRAVTAILLFAPWLLLNLMMLIHAGQIMLLHTLWLLVLWVSFLAVALYSGTAAANAAQTSSVGDERLGARTSPVDIPHERA
jgi:hypothetical protein